jgi:cytoskeletal protein CcmA (bactofilin family)
MPEDVIIPIDARSLSVCVHGWVGFHEICCEHGAILGGQVAQGDP